MAELIEPEGDADEVQEVPPAADRWSRRGSPFAEHDSSGADGARAAAADTHFEAGPRPPDYPRHAGAFGGTVVAIALGIIGFCLAFVFPLGALIVAALGLVLGIWGVYSRRRRAAIFGLVICCIAFATAGFNGAVELYTYVHGISPFETLVPVTVQE